MNRLRTLFFIAIGVFFSACVSPAQNPSSTLSPILTPNQSTPSSPPTRTPVPTVWPPVFDLFKLEDIRTLDSFVLTVNEKNTVNGQLNEIATTIGYIQEPYSAYALRKFSGGEERTYVVDDITYKVTHTGDWYLSGTASKDFFSVVDPAYLVGKLVDAQFAGQEEFGGILANHFILEPTTSTDSNVSLEGNFYVAHDGNYLISSYWKETVSQENFSQIYEITSEMSSINQVTEITLPSDLFEMKTAVELPLEIGLPLPADSNFSGMIRYKHGIGVDTYTFSTPKISIDEFLEYYKALPETNGWTVSHVGHVSLHESDCEFSRECVIINKGNTQVILYYNGASIRAEFDWPHLYSPR